MGIDTGADAGSDTGTGLDAGKSTEIVPGMGEEGAAGGDCGPFGCADGVRVTVNHLVELFTIGIAGKTGKE